MAKKNASGGSGTEASPYWATGPSYDKVYPYGYNPQNTYYTFPSGGAFTPTQEQIESGFIHLYSGYAYKTNPTITGAKLIKANIASMEKQMAQLNKDLEGLRAAEKMLDENPAWIALLDLHNRGLI